MNESKRRLSEIVSNPPGRATADPDLTDLSSDPLSSPLVGPGPDELVATGEIDEPVSQGAFLELSNLMAKLKDRRTVMGLSLADVSERSGLTRQAISRLENGWNVNPTLDTLYRYSLSLDAGITLGLEEIEPEGEEVESITSPSRP